MIPLLIKDLGTRYATAISKKKDRFGLYECPECGGHFEARTASIKNGNIARCAACANAHRTKTLQIIAEERLDEAKLLFKSKATAVHNGRYDYSNSDYINATSKINIICNIHGRFRQTPASHLNGCGCPDCASYGFNKTKPAILYYLEIITSSTPVYKIGITNRTIQERFTTEDLSKIRVLKILDFPLGADALAKEQEILNLYKEFKYSGEPLLSSGNTELFTTNIQEGLR